MKKTGFTLIELLIVVAIIAILAAIAIPNFLQAQVRAKVSRAKADMRTIATGLETFYVDKNRYPGDYSNSIDIDNPEPMYYFYYHRLCDLTTPIPYMSSVPADPFVQSLVPDPVPSVTLWTPYGNPADSSAQAPVLTFDYDCNNSATDPDEYETMGSVTFLQNGLGMRLKWVLRSVGPDGISTPIGYPNARIYDPTNGTTSFGEIYRTNLANNN